MFQLSGNVFSSNQCCGTEFSISREYSKKIYFFLFYQKLQFTYSLASKKDVQDIGEAFSPEKKTSSTEKDEIY
jgi:hypothetical protein